MKSFTTLSSPLIVTLSLLLLFTACGKKNNVFRFTGTISGITQTEFYIYGEGSDFTGFDTLTIKDGRFQYAKALEEPMLLRLMYPNFAYTYIVAEPGEELHMEAGASKLGEAVIKGTEENDLLSQFRADTHALQANEQQMAAAHFIQNNAGTLAAVAVFRKYLLEAKNIDADIVEPLLEELKKAQPEGKEVATLETLLRPMLNATVGKSLPAFEATTIDRNMLMSDSLRGKPLLIGFFSTWKNDNYQVVPQMARYEKEYPDSLGLLAISLDYDSIRCATRIQQDSLKAPVVCDRKALESPLVKQLGVRHLPGNILVNHKGIIVGRDIPLKELDKAVANVMSDYRKQ